MDYHKCILTSLTLFSRHEEYELANFHISDMEMFISTEVPILRSFCNLDLIMSKIAFSRPRLLSTTSTSFQILASLMWIVLQRNRIFTTNLTVPSAVRYAAQIAIQLYKTFEWADSKKIVGDFDPFTNETIRKPTLRSCPNSDHASWF